jgi:hypothetical protein
LLNKNKTFTKGAKKWSFEINGLQRKYKVMLQLIYRLFGHGRAISELHRSLWTTKIYQFDEHVWAWRWARRGQLNASQITIHDHDSSPNQARDGA